MEAMEPMRILRRCRVRPRPPENAAEHEARIVAEQKRIAGLMPLFKAEERELKRKIVVSNLGEVFESAQAAASALGVTYNGVMGACRNRKKCAGRMWKLLPKHPDNGEACTER